MTTLAPADRGPKTFGAADRVRAASEQPADRATTSAAVFDIDEAVPALRELLAKVAAEEQEQSAQSRYRLVGFALIVLLGVVVAAVSLVEVLSPIRSLLHSI